MIYAIRAAGTPYIKFGFASDVLRRVNEMDTGCPHDLEVLAAADWPNTAEKAVHKFLEPCWHKREWFTQSERTDQMISWLNEANGLESLRSALKEQFGFSQDKPKLRRRRALSIAGAREAEDPRIVARRSEREAWWAAQSTAQQQIRKSLVDQIPVFADSSVISEEHAPSG